MAPHTTPPDRALVLLLEDIDRGEPPLSCAEVRKLPCIAGEGGKPRDLSWVHRQRLVGTRGVDGQLYKLPMLRSAGGIFRTTRSAIIRWLRQVNGLPLSASGPSPVAQRDEHRRAKKSLAAQGL